MSEEMQSLLAKIRQCKHCEPHLALGAKPVFSAAVDSRILVIGQAPGRIVHQTELPWNDKSGDRLRQWLGVDRSTFYDTTYFALVPMGFCYPGTGKSGDLPPRPECAPLWHEALQAQMPSVRLTLLVGQYAQRYYLKSKETLTDIVRNFQEYLPQNYIPLPHPSPRNNIWQAKNPWFEQEVIPHLRGLTQQILQD